MESKSNHHHLATTYKKKKKISTLRAVLVQNKFYCNEYALQHGLTWNYSSEHFNITFCATSVSCASDRVK